MATWKKVIVSGSQAELANLTASLGLAVGTNQIITTTSAGTRLSGSFSGSFFGDGSGITSVIASFPTTAKTNLTSTDQFYINDGANKFITYDNLLTDLAGTNLAVESNDSLTLATTITGITSITATSVTASILGNLIGTASFATNALSASYAANVPLTASYALNAASASFASTAVSASYAANGGVTSIVAGTGVAVSSATGNVTVSIGQAVNTNSNVTFNDATINGNLTVAGTASFTNVDNLTIKDKFILINSGSSTLADSGWVTQYNASGQGSAFYLDADSTGTYGRFAVAYNVLGTATTVTPDEFVVTAKQAVGAPAADPTWGSTTNGYGNIYINSSNGDIYIYS